MSELPNPSNDFRATLDYDLSLTNLNSIFGGMWDALQPYRDVVVEADAAINALNARTLQVIGESITPELDQLRAATAEAQEAVNALIGNDFEGDLAGKLAKDQNLDDLPDKGAARTALELKPVATKDFASQAEAVAGEIDNKPMAPLPTAQAIEVKLSPVRKNLQMQSLLTASLMGDRTNLIGGWVDPLTDDSDIQSITGASSVPDGLAALPAEVPRSSFTPIASGSSSGRDPEYAFNGSGSNRWTSAASGAAAVHSTSYVGVDFGSDPAEWRTILKIGILQYSDARWRADKFQVKYSDDGVTWLVAAADLTPQNQSPPSGHAATPDHEVPATDQPHRYWAIFPDGNANYPTQSWDVYDVAMLSAEDAPLCHITSKPLQVAAEPKSGYAMLVLDREPAGLNTGFIAELSRDGGASWTPCNLSAFGYNLADGVLIAGEADFSGQLSGSDLLWRVRTTEGQVFVLQAILMEAR